MGLPPLLYRSAGISILTSGLTATIHPTAIERNAWSGFVGQPLLAVLFRRAEIMLDSQEWLSYENRQPTCRPGFDDFTPNRNTL